MVPIRLPHALDYLPDDPAFWDRVAQEILPEVVSALVGTGAQPASIASAVTPASGQS